ncbi:(4Fe-4S)-binding protein [Salmonirosea aquatica]|uniref:Iron-binding zinc finger CDGSH type domain-containing protein n=1 Tax=Salmonirosea aquatica TaxID=2654236 RepID=A0A7C9F360_9BACT|nr:hypothetical protein [Cytophagaceae bacterium SJW1-29]
MEKRITKTYDNGEITVVWQPHKCIHSAICFRGLPSVFNPQKRPWVDMDGADTETIARQVDRCPSGALSYRMDNGQTTEGAINEQKSEMPSTTVVEVKPNGPLLLYGDITVRDASGNEEKKSRTTAFCRCGQSLSKPYCDGSHSRTGFIG